MFFYFSVYGVCDQHSKWLYQLLMLFHIKYFMVTSKILLVFYHGFWQESHSFYFCLYTMLYFRIGSRLHRWRWHYIVITWLRSLHFSFLIYITVCYTVSKELHHRKYWETCSSPSSYIFLYKNFIRLISANEKELYKNNLRVKAPVLIKTLRFTES